MAENCTEPLITDPQADGSVPINAEPDINIGAVSTFKIESLKKGNWIAWRSRMITILQFHHTFGHIEGTVPKPTEPTAKSKWEQCDLLAQILIKNNMSDSKWFM